MEGNYSHINAAIELCPPSSMDISLWAAHYGEFLARLDCLQSNNSKLYASFDDLTNKIVEFKLKNHSIRFSLLCGERNSLQFLLRETTLQQTKISDLKNMQEEMCSQQVQFKQETEIRQQTLDVWV